LLTLLIIKALFPKPSFSYSYFQGQTESLKESFLGIYRKSMHERKICMFKEVVGVGKCPCCGFEVATPSKEWKYNAFLVKRFECPRCEKWFREYYYKGKLSFILIATEKGPRKVEGQ
jgi:hypothetical protein